MEGRAICACPVPAIHSSATYIHAYLGSADTGHKLRELTIRPIAILTGWCLALVATE